MTTITTDSIPTNERYRSTNQTWRYLATFAAGVALSVAVAAGISVTADDNPATPAPSTGVDTHISSDECPGFVGKPC